MVLRSYISVFSVRRYTRAINETQRSFPVSDPLSILYFFLLPIKINGDISLGLLFLTKLLLINRGLSKTVRDSRSVRENNNWRLFRSVGGKEKGGNGIRLGR